MHQLLSYQTFKQDYSIYGAKEMLVEVETTLTKEDWLKCDYAKVQKDHSNVFDLTSEECEMDLITEMTFNGCRPVSIGIHDFGEIEWNAGPDIEIKVCIPLGLVANNIIYVKTNGQNSSEETIPSITLKGFKTMEYNIRQYFMTMEGVLCDISEGCSGYLYMKHSSQKIAEYMAKQYIEDKMFICDFITSIDEIRTFDGCISISDKYPINIPKRELQPYKNTPSPFFPKSRCDQIPFYMSYTDFQPKWKGDQSKGVRILSDLLSCKYFAKSKPKISVSESTPSNKVFIPKVFDVVTKIKIEGEMLKNIMEVNFYPLPFEIPTGEWVDVCIPMWLLHFCDCNLYIKGKLLIQGFYVSNTVRENGYKYAPSTGMYVNVADKKYTKGVYLYIFDSMPMTTKKVLGNPDLTRLLL
uniref:Uncharacterized protein n=1 Tax=viral metagenome TaxID=1070528 RepID=A0A6C0CL04_9ZZZZ